MSTAKRRNDIVSIVKNTGSVTVEQLVTRYNVSVETVRRDLRLLDEKGLLRRTYGGAVKKEQTTWDMPYHQRMNFHYEQKEAIAKEAVLLLEDGDSLFLDGNTTGLVVSRYLPTQKELLVVTNSTMIALNIVQRGGRTKVFLVGGEVAEDGMTTGHKLYQELRQYRFDKAMFSCMGITPQGLFFSKSEPLRTAQALAEQAEELVLLADSSKMNRSAFFFGIETKRIDVLVTDDGIAPQMLDKLRDLVGKVVVAKA
ncbi:DeoR/GlpR family DNA-binding transcription regulator [Paenibacillus turpanensis]|uniref:DeoR/GlpR family DNA-binding transcription regulator n=1 Tax=Paenibacillus turpanensis TaxID=2689078 RepID=UPI00140AE284|nr:DeoR/GlpR family DNA-binding transcription regulator [Paenibacillus turpanensis]